MIDNEEFYNDNMDDILQAMLNKGKLQEDIKNAQPLGPKPAKFFTTPLSGDTVWVERTCRITGEEFLLEITLQEFTRWQGGENIQDVFPNLSKDHREILQTGYTPAEWKVIFSD